MKLFRKIPHEHCCQHHTFSSYTAANGLPVRQRSSAQSRRTHSKKLSGMPAQQLKLCQHAGRVQCTPMPGGCASEAFAATALTSEHQRAASPVAAPALEFGQWQLVSRTTSAGGILEVVAWEQDRMLRVWLPPGYSPIDAQAFPYPVLYLNDGQNLFGDCPTLSGSNWSAATAAAEGITSGRLPPFIIVGIDHAGPLRSWDYTPCKPGTGPGGFRVDAQDWPGGGVDKYLQRIREEIVPYVCKQYAASSDPRDMAFGGSSFGAIAALAAAMQGADRCEFGSLLIESPSLWIGDTEPEAFLKDVLAYQGSWPDRVYIGMGGQEYSGTRQGAGSEHDAHFASYLSALVAKLTAAGLGRSRLAWTFQPEHGHTESAWAARLPAALQFVCGGWWGRWQERYRDALFFTVPRRLKAGLPAQLLFFNARKSHSLSQCHGRLKLIVGHNGWRDTQHLSMQAAADVQKLQLPEQPLEAVLQQCCKQYQQMQHSACNTNIPSGNVHTSSGASNTQSTQPADHDVRQHGINPSLQHSINLPVASCGIAGDGHWSVVQLPALPADCYELNFVFSDEAGTVYDNNNSNDFYLPVRKPEPLHVVQPAQRNSAPSRGQGTVAAATVAGATAGMHAEGFEAVVAVANAAAYAPADEEAALAAAQHRLFFCMPPYPTAGARMLLYANRARLNSGLADAPNVKLHIAFNDWQTGHQQVDLKPTSLWRGEGLDWWAGEVQVPADAVIANLAFSAEWNGTTCWDNNHGHDYQQPVRSVAAAAAAAAAEAAVQATDAVTSNNVGQDVCASSNKARPLPAGLSVREVESCETVPHANGTLEILHLQKRSSWGGKSSKQRWWDERVVRVWLPPGFTAEAPPPGGWPALIMCDGQNIFEDWLAHQGVSWQLGHAASGLISVGAIPPCVCIGIDSAGPYRSYNYLPFPPGTGEGGFRGDAARWPGGGAHDFLLRLVHEILPMLQRRYNLSQCSSRLAFGGGSFAGVTALMAAMLLPDVFGGILVESPSLWVGEGRFLQDLERYKGRLPERLTLGCGTREYSATRDHERADVDELLLHQYHQAAWLLQERGLRGPERFKFLVEDGAGHHEGAWRWRLSGALQFLAQGWSDS